jgi:hypothetical protein
MRFRFTLTALIVILLTGCGGSSKSNFPTVGAARTYTLASFTPDSPVVAGKPTTVSFVIRQPNGKPLTDFRRGSGPHTGVHLILVRRDLAVLVHRHPAIADDGTISDSVTFSEPGPYRVIVDAYPNVTGLQQNFQLFGQLRVAGTYTPQALPKLERTDVIGGYRVSLTGKPLLHAIQASSLQIDVTTPAGAPAHFTPWYGALAHAIFFRQGSLDYFHTHVCAPGASGCTSALGGATVTGSSERPGHLTVGVLVPTPGTWRLFLQTQVNNRVLTAPFTLEVKP